MFEAPRRLSLCGAPLLYARTAPRALQESGQNSASAQMCRVGRSLPITYPPAHTFAHTHPTTIAHPHPRAPVVKQ